MEKVIKDQEYKNFTVEKLSSIEGELFNYTALTPKPEIFRV